MITKSKSLLVLTSTYPRWQDDTVPVFVESLCIELNKHKLDPYVIAPHSKFAKTRERLNGIEIIRFRYAPTCLENLAYGGGMLNTLKKSQY